jgi:hypothetical protein
MIPYGLLPTDGALELFSDKPLQIEFVFERNDLAGEICAT